MPRSTRAIGHALGVGVGHLILQAVAHLLLRTPAANCNPWFRSTGSPATVEIVLKMLVFVKNGLGVGGPLAFNTLWVYENGTIRWVPR